MHLQPTEACQYGACGGPARYLLVYLDDSAGTSVCLDHLGHAYDEAERANTASFLPVHIARIDQVVAA